MPHGVICLDCQRVVWDAHLGRCGECNERWRTQAKRRDGKQGSARRPSAGRTLTPARSLNHSIYRTARWREVRRTVIARDGGVCRVCGTDKDLTVHHIIPIAKDESLAFAPDNLACVCRRCHGKLDGGRAYRQRKRRR